MVAVFHNSLVQQFKQTAIFCASALLVLPVFQRLGNRLMQTSGAAQVGALMPLSVPGVVLAACGMPFRAYPLFHGSVPAQPNGIWHEIHSFPA